MQRIFDPYGSLSAALVGMEIHSQSSRGTGRTTQMIQAAVENGGGYIICNSYNKDYIKKLIKHMDGPRQSNRITVIDIPVNEYHRIDHYINNGPVYFDHAWLEDLYNFKLMEASNFLSLTWRKYPSPLIRVSNQFDNSYMQRFDYDQIIPMHIPKTKITP